MFTKYKMSGGLMVEMLGSLEPLSRHLLPPHLRHAPTRIEVIIYISTSRYLST